MCTCGTKSTFHGPGCNVAVPGYSNATGYWGSATPASLVQASQTPAQIRALLFSKLQTLGRSVWLWSPVTMNTPNALECTCFKDTSNRSDMPCAQCYGTKFLPGYIRFLHETVYMAAISPQVTLTNLVLDQTIQPYRLVIADGQLSGSVTSMNIPYSNPDGYDWDYRVDAYNINEACTIDVTFSTNAINWYPINSINGNNKPIGVGFLYVRVSMTRPSINTRSPEFDIVRLRHPKTANPTILILRPEIKDRPQLTSYGNRHENLNELFWTSGLGSFDPSITLNTQAEIIAQSSMYQLSDPTQIDAFQRYLATEVDRNTQLGQGFLTSQTFTSRKVLPTEVYSSLVF